MSTLNKNYILSLEPKTYCFTSVFSTDACLNYHCKKGKVCEVDESNTPMCVCQDPSTCPPVEGDFEHVSLKSARVFLT